MRSGGGFVGAVFLLVAVSSTTGCSWLFVQPLRPGGPPNCTTNRAAPVIDTIFTLTNVGSAIYVAGQDNVTNKGTAVSVGLTVAALWFSSAIYGYSKTSECEEALEEPRGGHYAPPRPLPPRRVAPRPPPPPAAPPPPSAAPPATDEVDPSVAPAPAPVPVAPQQDDSDEPGRTRPRGPPPPVPKGYPRPGE